ncbi:hypothetical protein [Anaerococcus porci]|uniref:hypothetical protein n=1 Tax=Anaerococcus porci TaxID=2652269 RepID=UPI002A760D72|nr:hypothetical protein [Anaerococcus porci]MDY3007230.1 hypothetical protein [Anaerococcus porci]
MDNSDYKYKFRTIAKDLGDYIKVIDDEKSLIKFILSKAREKGLKILLINDCYYIKNDKAMAVLHLNVSDKINRLSYIDVVENDDLVVNTNLDVAELSSLILLIMLLESDMNNFDILLTNNYVNDYDRDYTTLRSYIRSSNIINLNLNEADCIAESFASYTLSTLDLPIVRRNIDKKEFLDNNLVYRISLKNLLGKSSTLNLENILKNAIKMLNTFLRKIKSKVDIDLISFDGKGLYDSIATDAYVDIAIDKKYENDLLDIFKLYSSEYLRANLRIEPNLKFEIEKIEEISYPPMTEDSYNHISSFIELAINGIYSVDSNTKLAISSCLLSRAKTFDDKLYIIIIFRSLSEDTLKDMMEKIKLAAKINGAEIVERLSIPSWQNENNKLTNVFSNAFEKLFNTSLKIIKTQYSLDGILIFHKFNVNMVSLGVKYKQVDIEKSTFEYKDLLKTYSLIEEVLLELRKSLE